ncbi:MAG: DMT family protein, partial [Phycisphaeraceae bacterium]
ARGFVSNIIGDHVMWKTVVLLLLSNIFMTFAWYGHLKHKQTAIWIAIVLSWFIAFFEYCFQVPANRIGHNAGLTAAQLKTIQEVITLAVFVVFAWFYLKEAIRWNVIIGFVLICIGATFIFEPWKKDTMRVFDEKQGVVDVASHDEP